MHCITAAAIGQEQALPAAFDLRTNPKHLFAAMHHKLAQIYRSYFIAH
jgi:hypothetical protein